MSAEAAPVLAELVRGGHVESRHRGAIAVCAPDGSVIASLGDPETFVFLRSAAKPFQLLAFLASGAAARYDFPTEELAVMAASHSGEDRHVALVARLLATAGLSESALQCGTHPPYDSDTADRLLRDHEALTPLRHNCSGKHTGMLLFAHGAGWPVETYWRADHPVQRAVLASVSEVTGVSEDEIALATDGCGVPTFGMPLRALGTAFARLAAAPEDRFAERVGVPLARIGDAMSAHPELVGGETKRLDTALMRAVPRLVSKAGAEGIQAVALRPGLTTRWGGAVGAAVVIEDGDWARRAGGVATCALLAQLGVLDRAALRALESFAAPQIRDPRGEVSGEVRAAFAVG